MVIYFLCTLALGMLIQTGFWLLFSNFRFIWCLFDMTSYGDTLISYQDLARDFNTTKASFHNGRSITAAVISLQVIFVCLGELYHQIRLELLSSIK
ncbi:hypothetical protein PHAVU_008G256100 [Phaseolus vulgaris]|uniref:Uncharacterized protein n=1 Tax=Phaseolus vulgaris TaxID=3885 RepID=V7B8E1_PHAVU|nr:hypothetical protein PHAVU_008G256100g [Phaseolus vulgaris]ESW14137.1 hypothetical protein PHAVU_008G256100g [Phaseolus vulgaris]